MLHQGACPSRRTRFSMTPRTRRRRANRRVGEFAGSAVSTHFLEAEVEVVQTLEAAIRIAGWPFEDLS
jgi:hypothetical protein